MSEKTKELNNTLAVLCRELVHKAQEEGCTLRAFGSVGFYLKLQKFNNLYSSYREPLGDIDLVVQSKDILNLDKLFTGLSFSENTNFKRLFGYQRRIYYASNGITIEVYLDDLSLCQKVSIHERINLDSPTLCCTDLFLSKIQRIPLTSKDVFDLSLLLVSTPIGMKDPDGVNVSHIENLCNTNWRWWKTITTNLQQLTEQSKFSFIDQSMLTLHITSIMNAANSKRKTIPWYFRSFLGDNIRWYEKVE